MNSEQIEQYAEDLHRLAEFLAMNTEALADAGAYFTHAPTIYVYGDAEELNRVRRTIHFGGKWHKEVDEHSFNLVKQFGEKVTFTIYASRDAVCERVQVGTKTETVKDYDAVTVPTKEVEIPVYEYHCPPSLGGSNPDYIGE